MLKPTFTFYIAFIDHSSGPLMVPTSLACCSRISKRSLQLHPCHGKENDVKARKLKNSLDSTGKCLRIPKIWQKPVINKKNFMSSLWIRDRCEDADQLQIFFFPLRQGETFRNCTKWPHFVCLLLKVNCMLPKPNHNHLPGIHQYIQCPFPSVQKFWFTMNKTRTSAKVNAFFT